MAENNDMGKKKKIASIEALKFIYYVIVGIAFTEALLVFIEPHFVSFFLVISFLVTICRFIHGASLHFDVIESDKRKPLLDFIEFFFQASFFFLMSNSLTKPTMYVLYLILMLLFDIIWIIIVVKVEKPERFDKTAKQWLISDIVIIVVSALIIIFFPVIFTLLSFPSDISLIFSSLAIMILLISACIWDYKSNYSFYFP